MSVIGIAPVGVVAFSFTLGSPARGNDTNGVIEALGPDDRDEATADGPNADETLLGVGVRRVKDLQAVDIVAEELRRFLKGDAVLLLIGKVLGFIPFDFRWVSLTPMA